MKKLIKISAAVLLFAGVTACSKDALRTYDTKQQLDAVESVNDQFLLSSIIKQSTLFYQGLGYDNSKLPAAVQYMERNYQASDNTYAGFKQPAGELYSAMNVLKLVDGSISLAEKRNSKTHLGIFKVFRSLMFSFMTDFYGDIYYTEALKGREGILYPKYDNQADIYAGLLAELEEANTLIAEGEDEISPSYDLMFAGDKLKWQKFANSLRIRLLMRASNKLENAGAQIAAIVNNPTGTPLLTEADENASIGYIGATAENSWKGGTNNWGGQTGEGEFDRRRPAKTLVDKLYQYQDPRMAVWFAPVEKPWTADPAKNGQSVTTTNNGFTYVSTWELKGLPDNSEYVGKIEDVDKLYVGFEAGMSDDDKHGNGHYEDAGLMGNFKVSKFAKVFRENVHPLLKAVIMNSDEVQFILAEAAAKGWISGTDAYYRKGITNSMKRWGVSDADITAYLAQPSIALPGNTQGDLEKIADQKWLGLFLVSTEAYLDIRRTKLPNIFDNGRLTAYEFPVRFRYPGNELGQNTASYNEGVSRLSPAKDEETSLMWLLKP